MYFFFYTYTLSIKRCFVMANFFTGADKFKFDCNVMQARPVLILLFNKQMNYECLFRVFLPRPYTKSKEVN